MKEAFKVVILGCTGGPRENNLSGYLLSPIEKKEWIALDAGSLLSGIELALEKKSLDMSHYTASSLIPSASLLIEQIRGYLISHAHLDHIAAMVINSQIDSHKHILGLEPTITNLIEHIFNGRIWPNYGNEGYEPILNRYTYLRMPLHLPIPIPDTSMTGEAFLLSHPHGYPSTAFLIESNEEYLLYFGDTSSDLFESEKHLARVWRRVGPLIKQGKLHAIFLECSYPQKAIETAYGHLDTRLMIKEMEHLQEIAGCPLEGLNVMVTHRKENLRRGLDTKEIIREELLSMNKLGLNLIFPSQGEIYNL